jgi:hypothetical protein
MRRYGTHSLRQADTVVTSQDEDEMKNVLEQALIVIDERDFERSLHDPRVRALYESGAKILAELEAEGADYR